MPERRATERRSEEKGQERGDHLQIPSGRVQEKSGSLCSFAGDSDELVKGSLL